MHLSPLVRALLALLPATLVACGSPKGAPESSLPVVSVVTLSARPYRRTVDLPGRTTAYLVAAVAPQVTGIIQRRLFDEGTEVNAGDVLYQIDPAPYQAALESAQATLAKAAAAVSSARPLAERDGELARIDAVSKEELEIARATLKQDEAAVLAAQAEVDTARINLGYTQIKAPIAGTVSASAFTAGALVTANQASALTTIYAYDPIYIDVTQPSSDVLKLREEMAAGVIEADSAGGARIRVTLEDGKVYPHEGRLQFAGVAVNESTGTITLRAIVPNPDKLLMPGMYVHARVDQGLKREVLLVPQQAISRDVLGNAAVIVIDRANRARQREVTVSGTDEGQWAVEGGLNVGDRVVVEGSQNIREGDVVIPHAFIPDVPSALATK